MRKLKPLYLIGVLLVTLSSCKASSSTIKLAQELCAPNGGVRYLYAGVLEDTVTCNNWAEFRLTSEHYRRSRKVD